MTTITNISGRTLVTQGPGAGETHTAAGETLDVDDERTAGFVASGLWSTTAPSTPAAVAAPAAAAPSTVTVEVPADEAAAVEELLHPGNPATPATNPAPAPAKGV